MRTFVVAAGIAGLGMVVGAQGQDARPTLAVGTAVASRGQTAYGELAVPPGSDAAATMPVAVIHGAHPGKVVAFVAGSHGTEYASIVALTRLIARIDPQTLAGSVIVAPLLNVASFEQMTVHVNPIDRKGMNAGYPGSKDGTQTERALALVAAQIVEPADVVVDLHGGDLDEDLRPYSYLTRTGNAAQDDAAQDAGAGVRPRSRHRARHRRRPIRRASAALSGYALSRGKTVLVAEAGRSGMVLPEDVDALINGCLNVLGIAEDDRRARSRRWRR